jgi:surfeit locus 1 family protein
MKELLRMFSRRWRLATLLVIAGAGLCVRLGIWQLDRLEQRRAFNSRVQAQLDQPPLTLSGDALQQDLYHMEYRQVVVRGKYDHSQEIALSNQYWENQWGVHLITPLIISGEQQAILIDRGWIPGAEYQSQDWSKYHEPGEVIVHGVLRRPLSKAEMGGRTDPTLSPGEALRKTWNFVNIEQLARQISYPLLPAYIQQAPDPAWSGLPYRSQPELELSEGPHMSYALQWFTFAILLVAGYPFFIRRQERNTLSRRSEQPSLPGSSDEIQHRGRVHQGTTR